MNARARINPRRWQQHRNRDPIDLTISMFAKRQPKAGLCENSKWFTERKSGDSMSGYEYFKNALEGLQLQCGGRYNTWAFLVYYTDWVKDAKRDRHSVSHLGIVIAAYHGDEFEAPVKISKPRCASPSISTNGRFPKQNHLFLDFHCF